ncbi:MAG: hypothetical protein GEV06_21165 [Luteitalea sp.]|nr:hypothetical protein [Luteitalea sp.]
MIWYCHWVEMRLGALVFVGLCVWLGVSILGPWHSLEFGQPLPLTPLGQAIGADQVLVWAEFAGRILPFSLAASLALSGAGFRTFFMPVAPVVYTLTLPISRSRLIWTRLAAGLAVACVGATALTAGGVAWFTMRGQTVPMVEVLQSLVLGVVVLAAMLAIVSAAITALPTAWAFLGLLAVLALAIPNSYVVSAPARDDVPWLAVAGYVMALVATVLFTLSYVRAREY